MRQRHCAGKPPAITFTSDFHELLTGDLRPGASLLLRYDPLRIIPAGEPYRFGDPQRPVFAHLQFARGAPPLDVRLASPAGIIPCPDADATGQGSMLSAALAVPAEAERLVVWFSYASAAGGDRYDSDYGANYRFGFACREVDVLEASVAAVPDGTADRFRVVVRSSLGVDDVRVHYVLVADAACVEHELQARWTGPESGQRNTGQPDTGQPDAVRWAASAQVPRGASVRFRVCYWIGGRRLLDDDGGAWYLVPEPRPDQPPPPPAALLDAAAAWG